MTWKGNTDVAFLEGFGCRNSRMNDPENSEYGPPMTGSSSFEAV